MVAYGALLPQRVLDIPPHGWVNLHFSLLPAWRGAAPVQHAILAGDADHRGDHLPDRARAGRRADLRHRHRTDPAATDTSGDLLRSAVGQRGRAAGADPRRDRGRQPGPPEPQPEGSTSYARQDHRRGRQDRLEPAGRRDRPADPRLRTRRRVPGPPSAASGSRSTRPSRPRPAWRPARWRSPSASVRCRHRHPRARARPGAGARARSRCRPPTGRAGSRSAPSRPLARSAAGARLPGRRRRRPAARSPGTGPGGWPSTRCAGCTPTTRTRTWCCRRCSPSAGSDGRDAAFATELLAGTCRWLGTYDLIIEAAAGRSSKQRCSRRCSTCSGSARISCWHAGAGPRRRGRHRRPGRGHGRGAGHRAGQRRAAQGGGAGRTTAGSTGSPLGSMTATRWRCATAHPRWIVDGVRRAAAGRRARAALPANNDSAAGQPGRPPGLGDGRRAARRGSRAGVRCARTPRAGPGNPPISPPCGEGTGRGAGRGLPAGHLGAGRIASTADRGPWLDLCAGPGRQDRAAGRTGRRGRARAGGRRDRPAPGRAGRGRRVRGYPPDRRPTVLVADGTRPAWADGTLRPGARRRAVHRARRAAPPAGVALATDSPPTSSSCTRCSVALLTSAIDSSRAGGVVGVRHLLAAPAGDRRRGHRDAGRRATDVELVPAAALLPELADAASTGRYLQLWPHRHGTDAMFAAYLRRR